METLRKVLKIILKVAVGIVILVGVSLLAYSVYTTSRLPYMKICRSLGRNPWTEPDCRGIGGISRIIKAQFPAETTTRDGVQSVLGEYRIRTQYFVN